MLFIDILLSLDFTILFYDLFYTRGDLLVLLHIFGGIFRNQRIVLFPILSWIVSYRAKDRLKNRRKNKYL